MKLHSQTTHDERGFALIITVSMLVLVAVVAVGLLSLSTVSLRASGRTEARAEARANARLGLITALGEIQKALGPDQRVTARSEILSEDPAYPMLTGVFRTARAGLPTDPAGYFESLRSEGRDDAVWLVSSVAPVTDPTSQKAADLNDEGLAPMQSIHDESGNVSQIEAGKIPVVTGSSGAAGKSSGSYAWWVDDESQKAKLNLNLPDRLGSGEVFEEHWRLGSAQHANFFRVDADPSSANYEPVAIEGYDPEDGSSISKLISVAEADIPYEVNGDPDWFSRNQTDFTTYSEGLPVDVLEGRLKQDLSFYLETGKGLGNDEPLIRGSGSDAGYNGPELAGLDYTAQDMPRFGLIKSWKEIGSTVEGFDAGGTESSAHTESEHGIHPVILRAGIYYAPYMDSSVRSEMVGVLGEAERKEAFYVTWKLAAYPRVTIWNPTSVPITDPWLLYQVGVTNHFMLVLSGSESGRRGGGAARDDRNVEYWRTFNDSKGRLQAFYNMMRGIRSAQTIPSGGTGAETMPLHTYALRLDSPLLPGQTRTFYPQAGSPLLKSIGRRGANGFERINLSNIESGNVMTSTPAPNNYFRVGGDSGKEFEGKIYAKAANGDLPASERPTKPLFLETYLYLKNAESGPDFKGVHTNGCGYRLFKPRKTGSPTLLQEIFSAEHTKETGGYPSYSISSSRGYDDPDDGVASMGFSLVKFYDDPNRELSSRRGHQLYISYALEDPKSDFGSIFKDSSKQYSSLAHYNPRSRHIFPGTFEEERTGVGGQQFKDDSHGVRQELYSEGRPEGAWLNDWAVESARGSEGGYGANTDFGSPGLYDLNLAANGLVYPLFDFPRGNDGVLSLGELQGVNFASYPWQPGNAFGNSRADSRVPRNQIINSIDQGEDHPYIRSLSLGTNRYVDLSWLLNHSMWDRFFVSTIDYADSAAVSSAGATLRNARHKLTPREGQNSDDELVGSDVPALDKAAANIRIDGAFNVNTTSVAAWKQLLSTNFNRQLEVKNTESGEKSTPEDQAVFPRLLYPYRAELASGDRDVGAVDEATRAAFSANRSLTDEEVQRLAEKIVEEVKLRGPFLSLSDFVNRRLVEDNDSRYGEWAGLSGVLQTAIDRVTVEDDLINDHLEAESDLTFTKGDVPAYLEQSHVVGRPGDLSQSRLAGAPGSLSQADVLRTIGPVLTARGDTFRIRAYGESRQEGTGKALAEAWCEAVVQRIPEPVDVDDDLVAPDAAKYPFGRKFQVVSFRWLTKEEI